MRTEAFSLNSWSSDVVYPVFLCTTSEVDDERASVSRAIPSMINVTVVE